MKVLAIVPARAGSKGIPGKNVREINGRPLIAYTLDAGRRATKVDELIVSTDDPVVVDICEDMKVSVHHRSVHNATDESLIEDTLLEVLDTMDKVPDLIVLLQVTSPLRTSKDIDLVVEMFERDPSLENVVSVIPLNDIHPARMYHIEKNSLKGLDPRLERKRRQELDTVYIRNGAIYAVRTTAFLHHKRMIMDSKSPYIMDESTWLNLDTERDLIIAPALMKVFFDRTKGNL